jgi:PAS domain S-box-containing protein
VAPVPEEHGAAVRRAVLYFLDGGPAADLQAERAPEAGAEESRRLREELRLAEERLKFSRTEHEGALQDLRIGNEELQSINEEYRSTSEELETCKEELQSMNEELQTVNNELKSKLESISTAHSDLRNLVASTEIGTLFLDPELRIRMFTPAVADLFSVTEADVGRHITDFTHRLDKDGLDRDAQLVLRTLAPHEEEVASRDGRWLMMRLRPYRTVDDRIDGLVVTFFDITARKRAEEALADELKAMSRLQKISTRVVRADDLEGPLGTLLDAAIELLGADLGNIQLFDEDAKSLRIAVQRGFEQAFLDRFAEVDADEPSACGLVLAERQPVMIEDVEADPRFAPSRDAAKAAGYRAVLSVPLFKTGGGLVGVLSTHFRDVRRLSDRDRRLSAIYARQAADAIDAYQLQARLRASELRLRKVLETEAVGVLFFDNAGTMLDANDAFLRMTGYTREQVQRGALSWQELTPPEHLTVSEAQLEQMQRTDSIGPYEKEYLCADGSRRWMLFAGRRIEPNLISEYVIDITNKRRGEEERELLSRELSHRVKNTLAVVQALARQTRGGSVEAYREAFLGRLKALANGHSLLLQSDWQSAEFGAIVNDAMAVYGDNAGRFADRGCAGHRAGEKGALTQSRLA